MFKVGDTIKYKILDMESYSRGYGLHYETKTAKIKEIRYEMENHDTIRESNLRGTNPEVIKEGATLSYEIMDGEEGRGYGWFKAKKTAKVACVLYRTDLYDDVKDSHLVQTG
jgi:hypothetical protein